METTKRFKGRGGIPASDRKKPKCAEGCNAAEFLIVNGQEKTYYCKISAEEEIFSMVENNDTVTFHTSDKNKLGITTIEVM